MSMPGLVVNDYEREIQRYPVSIDEIGGPEELKAWKDRQELLAFARKIVWEETVRDRAVRIVASEKKISHVNPVMQKWIRFYKENYITKYPSVTINERPPYHVVKAKEFIPAPLHTHSYKPWTGVWLKEQCLTFFSSIKSMINKHKKRKAAIKAYLNEAR